MSSFSENSPKKMKGANVVKNNGPLKMDDGKIENFEKFIEKAVSDYEGALTGYARTYLYDLERARDVVQDTFIRLCSQDRDKVSTHLKSWLFTVCRNRCLDILRKDKRVEPLDEIRWQKVAGDEPSPAGQLEEDESLAEIMHYMERLGKNQKEVILLKFQQGLSYKEIQEVTGLKQGNIGFLIHEGIKRLRELLPPGNKKYEQG